MLVEVLPELVVAELLADQVVLEHGVVGPQAEVQVLVAETLVRVDVEEVAAKMETG